MSSRPWTDSDKRRLNDLYSQGHSTAEIGRMMGRSKNSIMSKVVKYNLPRRGSPILMRLPIPTHFTNRRDVSDWRKRLGTQPLPVGAIPLPPLPSERAAQS